MYSRLRFLNSAALITFGVVIAVGVPALLLTAAERPRDAQTEISGSCLRQALLHFDRSCLSSTARRDLPWMAARGASNPLAVESSSAADNAPEQPAAGTQDAATVPQELTRQSNIEEPEHAAAVPPAAPAPQAVTVEVSRGADPAVEQPSTQTQDAAAAPQEPERPSEIEATGHGTPVPPAATTAKAVAVEVSPRAETAVEQPVPQAQNAAAVPQEPVRPSEIEATGHGAPVLPAAKAVTTEVSPGAETAVEQPAPQAQNAAAVPQELPSGINAPQQAASVPPSAAAKGRRVAKPAKETRVAKPATETHARLPAPKAKTADRKVAKRSTNEALAAVRRDEDTLHDIPVSAYAPDGTRRNVVIRPTNVQDVYYYSVPR